MSMGLLGLRITFKKKTCPELKFLAAHGAARMMDPCGRALRHLPSCPLGCTTSTTVHTRRKTVSNLVIILLHIFSAGAFTQIEFPCSCRSSTPNTIAAEALIMPRYLSFFRSGNTCTTLRLRVDAFLRSTFGDWCLYKLHHELQRCSTIVAHFEISAGT